MTALDPDGDEARDLLGRELLRPEYNEENPLTRFLDWLLGRLDAGLAAADGVDPLVALAGMVVLLALAVGVALLLARARSEQRGPRPRGVLSDVTADPAELRADAERAYAEGRHEDALLGSFRAMAARAVAAGTVPDEPGATAREVAERLAAVPVGDPVGVREAARLFDGVLYGDRRVTAEQAAAALALDAPAGVR